MEAASMLWSKVTAVRFAVRGSRLACGNAGGGKFDRRDFPGFFNKEKKQDDEKNSSGLFDKL